MPISPSCASHCACTASGQAASAPQAPHHPQLLDSLRLLALNNGVEISKSFVLNELCRYEDAFPVFARVLALKPENPVVLHNQGNALYWLGRYTLALESYNQSLALRPDNAGTWRAKGLTLAGMQHHAEALDAFEHALTIDPKLVLAWISKGDMLRELHRYEEACDAFAEALRLDPDNEYAPSRLRAVQALLKREIPDKLLRLRDGRQLGYIDCGDPDGKPVLCCHGLPGSRLDWVLYDDHFRTLGLRLIAPDRPGYGLSDFKEHSRILDWPGDVAQFADALRIERFGVLGVSGGGPFAAACAFKLPKRITKLALVSSAAPPFALGVVRGSTTRIYLTALAQWLIPWMVWRHLGRCAKVFRSTRRPWDRALVDGNRKNFCHFT